MSRAIWKACCPIMVEKSVDHLTDSGATWHRIRAGAWGRLRAAKVPVVAHERECRQRAWLIGDRLTGRGLTFLNARQVGGLHWGAVPAWIDQNRGGPDTWLPLLDAHRRGQGVVVQAVASQCVVCIEVARVIVLVDWGAVDIGRGRVCRSATWLQRWVIAIKKKIQLPNTLSIISILSNWHW